MIYINNTFSILHLSDLHIVQKNNTYQSDLDKLIDDVSIQVQENHITKLIIVVSGDIIDKGNYDNEGAAIKFFKNLRRKLNSISDQLVEDIQIVPGNHDRERNIKAELYSRAFQSKDTAIDNEKEWELYKENNEKFLSFANDIYEIFGKTPDIKDTFGCELKQVGNNRICFLRIDTAWSEYVSQSCKKLRIGSYQLSSLKNQLDSIRTALQKKGEKIDVTIAITHHPLSWLTPADEISVKSFFMKEDFLDVDMLLSGHVHNQSVENLYNHEHSILTLVTGIGWLQDDPQRNKEYRYSIYSLNVFRNCCEIIVRKTNRGNSFDFDYSIYTDKKERLTSKLLYPIKMMSSYPFIDVNSLNDVNKTGVYVDVNIMNKIREITWAIMDLKNALADSINGSIEFFALQRSHFNTAEKTIQENAVQKKKSTPQQIKETTAEIVTTQEIKEHLKRAKNNISYTIPPKIRKLIDEESAYRNFSSLLRDVCFNCVNKLRLCFSDDVTIRVHMRWLFNKSTYSQLCYHCSDPTIKTRLKDLPWEASMAEAAYNSGGSVVYSSNKWQSSIVTDWDDFITGVPKFKENVITIVLDNGRKEERPAITFGISVKNANGQISDEDSLILYLLSYLKIEELVSDVLEKYVNIFDVKLQHYLHFLRNQKKEENPSET